MTILRAHPSILQYFDGVEFQLIKTNACSEGKMRNVQYMMQWTGVDLNSTLVT